MKLALVAWVRRNKMAVQLLCFLVVFSAAGSALLLASHAATQTASVEPETGAVSGASTVTDGTTSGGAAVQFGNSAPSYFGTLGTVASSAQQESNAGVKVAMLELNWGAYEPSDGQFDANYINYMHNQFAALRAAGMQVTLGLGVHFTPGWVINMANSRYVDQTGASASEANVIFNQKIRDKVAAYYAQIDRDFGMQNFWAIRLSSGGDAEMLYPGGGTYYAYDANAQNGVDMPSTMVRNPLPGWKAGSTGMSSAQVTGWMNWYIGALDDVTNWQMTLLNSLGFAGYYQLLTPGSGTRPDGLANDITNNLPASVTAVGAVWDKYYAGLASKQHVVTYVSSVADNSGNNDSCTPADSALPLSNSAMDSWSATRWLTRVANANGLLVGGENPGYNIPASLNSFYVDTSANGMMATALRQAHSCGFQTFYWAHDYRLYDGTQTFANYATGIQLLHGGNNPSPVLP